LAANCFACHAAKVQRGGFRLDVRMQLLAERNGGAVVIAGEPEHSRLIRAIGYAGPIKMPPAGKLRAEEIAALTAWVKMGAPWPESRGGDGEKGSERDKPTKSGKPEKIVTATDKNQWPFKPFSKPAPPAVKNTT